MATQSETDAAKALAAAAEKAAAEKAAQTKAEADKASAKGKGPMMTVEILRDYWPKDQHVENPDPLVNNEVRHVAAKPGEKPTVVDLPQDEAIDLIEKGAAKQWKGAKP